MRNKVFALFLIVPLLFGCGTFQTVVPETARESLVAAEVTFQGLVASAQEITNVGFVTRQSPIGQAIVRVLGDARFALDAWHMAVESPQAKALALQRLSLARSVLTSFRRNMGDPT